MRLVLDTNSVVSGLLWHGLPGKLIDAAQNGAISLYTSAPLLAELRGVLLREKFAKQVQARGIPAIKIFDGYAALAILVAPASISPVVANDPADDAVLACALAAKADLIVSGDNDLRSLKIYQDIPIVTPAEAYRRLAVP